ncbi:MAG: phenylalanine--tRNA ligase subunit beta [Proteobacteria bacterium]|nr:phenylalanine--tRNA ligase subunit beta [Pseudomonadota bacterium]
MKVLFNWLKDFIDIEENPSKIAENLTMVGLEIEQVIFTKELFKNIVIGKIVKVEKHPSSDKLKVCDVSIGSEILKIVCGAPNVEEGKNAVLALPGAELQGNKIEKVNIRGVESNGMLCSEKDLGLAIYSEGIILSNENLKLGKPVYQELYRDLDDVLLEINITPNRGDCLSHLGIAREISAITGKKLKKILSKPPKLFQQAKDFEIIIEDPKLCSRYTGKLVRNIEIKPSPNFIKVRLSLCGMRPINNIVDITNYVMLGYGQPLHAFDYDLITDKTIIVRRARNDEKTITLDGKERILNDRDLVIADPEKIIALAGVMGGANSEVNSNTKNILIESAYFDPPTIRKTAKKLNLGSEASYRFERGVDIGNVPIACEIAGQMMEEFANGQAICGVYDNYPLPYEDRIIKFRPNRCNGYLGTKLTLDEMEKRLVSLQFEVTKKRFEWDVKTPTFRNDISIEEDIFEEIARMGFYQEITTQLPNIPMKSREDISERKFERILLDALVDFGGNEIITYSFVREKELEKIRYDLTNKENFVYIQNPLSDDKTLMRPTLIASHLIVAEANHLRMNYDFIFFERGKCYFKLNDNGNEYKERKVIGLVFSGLLRSKEWYGQEEKIDFFSVKGFLEKLCERICKKKTTVQKIEQGSLPFLHPIESAYILLEDKKIGFFGRIHPDVLEKWDFKRELFVAEIDYNLLRKVFEKKENIYYSISKFPWVDRDITIIIDDKVSYDEVMKVLLKNSGNLVKQIKLVDLYKGEKLGENKKSLTFKLLYQHKDRTLSDDEVNEENSRIAKLLIEHFKAEFPK